MSDLQTLAQRVLGLLLIVVTAWAGSLLARSVWQILEPVPEVRVSVDWDSATRMTSGNGTTAAERAEQVARSHWFGEQGEEPEQTEPEPVQAVEMPETRLQLQLKGVVARQDPRRGSALIAQRGRNSEYFRVGDTLFEQAELVEIYGDRVVLNRGGELETLSFEDNRPEGSNGSDSVSTASRESGASSEQPVRSASRSAPQGGTSSGSSDSRSDSRQSSSRNDSGQSGDSAQRRLEEDLRQAMQEVQARAQSDPQGLLRQYGLEATDNGYRVTSRAGTLIANGLRPGDRITEINDQPVGNIDRDQQLVDSVLSSDQIKITLERSGATYRFYQSLPSF